MKNCASWWSTPQCRTGWPSRPRPGEDGERRRRKMGSLQSQKILLTWMIEECAGLSSDQRYITPEDFTEELYRKVAELLYQQYEEGEANPAQDHGSFHGGRGAPGGSLPVPHEDPGTDHAGRTGEGVERDGGAGEGPQHRGGSGPSGPHGYPGTADV